MEGVPEGWGTCPFFSSEKSCLITSKKLLIGLPRYTDRKKRGQKGGKRRKRTNKLINNGVHRKTMWLNVKWSKQRRRQEPRAKISTAQTPINHAYVSANK